MIPGLRPSGSPRAVHYSPLQGSDKVIIQHFGANALFILIAPTVTFSRFLAFTRLTAAFAIFFAITRFAIAFAILMFASTIA